MLVGALSVFSLNCGDDDDSAAPGGAGGTGVIVVSDVPDAISGPQPDAVSGGFLKLHAIWTQNYSCTVTDSGGTIIYAWTIVGPSAELFDDNGDVVGHHNTGPLWAYDVVEQDGSSVQGHKIAGSPSPNDPLYNVPWLLLNNVNFDPATNTFWHRAGRGFLINPRISIGL